MNDILKALQALECVVDGGHPTGGELAGCITREIERDTLVSRRVNL